MRYVNGSNNTNNLDTPNDNNNTNHGNHSRNDHYNQYNFMNNHPLRHMSSFANYDSVAADCYSPIQRQQQKYYNSLDNHDADDLQEYSINSGYISNFDDVNNGINGFPPLLNNGINNNANNILANKIMRKRRQDMYFSPHNFRSTRSKRIQQVKNFCYTAGFVIILLFLVFLSFMSGFLLATTKELQDTKVDKIFDIIISQEELVFNLEVESFNPGLFGISIVDVELDVFAKTKFVDPSLWYSDPSCSYDMKTLGDPASNYNIDNSKELEEDKSLSFAELGSGTTKPFYTVMLGSVNQLDIPLHFHGGFFTRQKSSGVTEIKIKDPCRTNHDDDDDSGGDGGNGGEGEGEDDDAIHTNSGLIFRVIHLN
ncbi:unnamed protein product [[Candida] boidinii]|nr:unnamed protein product [[Candida] boidinii]